MAGQLQYAPLPAEVIGLIKPRITTLKARWQADSHQLVSAASWTR